MKDSRPTLKLPPPPPKSSQELLREIDDAYAQMVSLEKKLLNLRMAYHAAIVEGR